MDGYIFLFDLRPNSIERLIFVCLKYLVALFGHWGRSLDHQEGGQDERGIFVGCVLMINRYSVSDTLDHLPVCVG